MWVGYESVTDGPVQGETDQWGGKGYSDHILLTFTPRKRIKAHQTKYVCTPVLMETCTGAQ